MGTNGASQQAHTSPTSPTTATGGRNSKNPSNTSRPTKKRKSPSTKAQRSKDVKAFTENTGKNRTIQRILILDSGGNTIKHISMPYPATSLKENPARYEETPNFTAKLRHQLTVLVGDEIITSVKNKSQLENLTSPLERGYCTDLGTQLRIWNRVLTSEGIYTVPYQPTKKTAKPSNAIPTDRCCLLVLTQPLTLRAIGDRVDEVLFEDLGFGKVCKRMGSCMAAHRYNKEMGNDGKAVLIVDSGFSVTHVVPTFEGYAVEKGIKRVNIGGKLLTNLLKQSVSYRQWNMMDEFYLMNDVKEKCCFVSADFDREMNLARKKRELDVQFVLPDFVSTFEGFVKKRTSQEEQGHGHFSSDNDNQIESNHAKENQPPPIPDNIPDQDRQILSLSTERFTVPEVLFRPSDIGIQQVGIAEAIAQSIEACDASLRPALWNNVLFLGGNAKFPGMQKRLERELRSLAPNSYPVKMFVPDDPVGYAVEAAKDFVLERGDDFLRDCCLDKDLWERVTSQKNYPWVWGDMSTKEDDVGHVLL